MTGLTSKGAATRDRIVRAATELILDRGVTGMTLDEIRVGTRTSKSQLFHYFPGGKSELVGAIAGYQNSRVMAAQQPWLERLDSWESWQGWRDAVVAYYSNLTHKYCSVTALVNDVAPTEPELAAQVSAYADQWREDLAAGLRRMRDGGLLRPSADPERLALTVFASLQGGLLVMQSQDDIEPLAAVLDGALVMLRAYAAEDGAAGSKRGTART
ncbi:TetR/AcrR family transcriptional regulator [Paractinoplanes lichenicola]|uniref:TetR/AcrR family transcriptional regulator n=1 Tax=Paractinoplanes lichenicola TaxID=2802976 RepID=A0ABS1VDI2_9ACTN|nr:TetR/AcrR family transcriptional regulator [Actinoplanes lichenicola]MBL7252738.1 TetR/AcrR family transcriptional regulator [Actinoplanes lichenicola]